MGHKDLFAFLPVAKIMVRLGLALGTAPQKKGFFLAELTAANDPTDRRLPPMDFPTG